jgi:hypothetical protein
VTRFFTTQEPQTVDLWFVPHPVQSALARVLRNVPIHGVLAPGSPLRSRVVPLRDRA